MPVTPVSEERLRVVVTRERRTPPRLYERNPVAGLIVESMAKASDRHEHAVRDAGAFLLDLLRANEPEAPCLSLPVAMRVLARDEARPMDDVCCYLSRTARQDVLLGIAVHALVGGCVGPRRRRQEHTDARREAVIRTLYLLLRMFEAQQQVDDLHHHYAAD
ncbi:MAG TPA: hypothetical protein VM324_16905 [Egibacteraceae bacterium]|jgi:hypothetical protein|nr:hypothetical protein [Egibacteraceae bacterium]